MKQKQSLILVLILLFSSAWVWSQTAKVAPRVTYPDITMQLVDEAAHSSQRTAVVTVTETEYDLSDQTTSLISTSTPVMASTVNTTSVPDVTAQTVGTTVTKSIGDPVSKSALAQAGAHFHYQLDNQPIIESHSTIMTFGNLSSGPHQISVFLVDDSERKLTSVTNVTVKIP